MRAYTGAKGLERASQHAPDAIIVDANLPDMSGTEVCKRLRSQEQIGPGTPILISSSERPSRHQRLASFRAGAWDFIVSPVDAEELVLRLQGYVQAKLETDRVREESLVDELTGLYNLRGLERRVQEVKSRAYREENAMACVVISPREPVEDGPETAALIRRLAETLTDTGRISDVIGRLGKSEFAVIAPSTDSAGAARLAERIAKAIRSYDGPDLRVGYDAVSNVREAPGEAQELLMHATMALRKSKSNGKRWLRAYRDE